MPFRSYFIPSELVKSEFVSLGNYSKGFHAASNRFEGSHIIENWKHFQGQNYVTKRTCGDRGELGLSKSRAVEICDQIFLFFSKKISSRFDMMRVVVVAHFFFFLFFFFLFGHHVRDAVTKWPLVALGGILEQTGPSPLLQLCQTLCRQAKAT